MFKPKGQSSGLRASTRRSLGQKGFRARAPKDWVVRLGLCLAEEAKEGPALREGGVEANVLGRV